ncbi:MAG: DNA polymerase III subunit chi [Acidobacteriota bacterium]|jgi:DNA polymerase-3 subunit chi|nr:DNA polymerase III subunit chi [Acidobacteriota bacterium]
MTECIFHDAPDARKDPLIFEIAASAYRDKHKVLIYAENAERAAVLDRLLWILKQESFIPHRIFAGGETDAETPVGIVTVEDNPVGADILVADGRCSLDFTGGFDAVHEFVVHSSQEVLDACRARFRDYRDRQILIRHIKES